MKNSQDAVRNHQLTLSLLNHGVQAGVRFILTAAHSEDDIQFTVDAYGKAFAELREVGLL